MTRLSININKIATLRNSRGGNVPDVLQAAVDCQRFGAQGITVHPRPDERHIRYSDAKNLKPLIVTEFNIEGNPVPKFIDLILEVCPDQVTLVPDTHSQITSNAGWDTRKHKVFLKNIISIFKKQGIRTSVFVDTDLTNICHAAETETDRIELYTEPYAANFVKDRENAIKPFIAAAEKAAEFGLGINAGHDLNLANLNFFNTKVPHLLEVSIGHAVISDAIYLGLENTIQIYLKQLKQV
ncbi:MAG: pyridoxine 5'-phosphate synthase [Prevotellaceae bacterium]|jgi:pyridoxine 5-phosphate synthase|nr:pyridoxine 5'-phosphate synthase [Prevotellaceae bacterium]